MVWLLWTLHLSSVLEERLLSWKIQNFLKHSLQFLSIPSCFKKLLELTCHEGFNAGGGSRAVQKAGVSTSAMPWILHFQRMCVIFFPTESSEIDCKWSLSRMEAWSTTQIKDNKWQASKLFTNHALIIQSSKNLNQIFNSLLSLASPLNEHVRRKER